MYAIAFVGGRPLQGRYDVMTELNLLGCSQEKTGVWRIRHLGPSVVREYKILGA
jgi:hypothetical protein